MDASKFSLRVLAYRARIHISSLPDRLRSTPNGRIRRRERAPVRSDAGTLEINFQTEIKRETKKLILYLTH
jgi:hypothetical protein